MLGETSTEAPDPHGEEAGEQEGAAASAASATRPPSSLTPSPASSTHTCRSRNRWWSPASSHSPYSLRSRNRCTEKEERHGQEQRLGLGDTIAMLINGTEDADINREPYTITYPVSGNDGPNVVTSLKLRSVPNNKVEGAGDDTGDIVFPIPAKDRERSFCDDHGEKEDNASEAIIVVGFVDYELLVGVESQPSLGARLIAVNDVSVEVRDWTLPKLLGELEILCEESAEFKEPRVSLTFRNDRLSEEKIAFLNSNCPRHGKEEPNDDEGHEQPIKSIFTRIRSTARSVAEAASTIDDANESEIRAASRAKSADDDTGKNPNREHCDNNDNDHVKESTHCETNDTSITVEEQTSSPRSSLFGRIRPRAAVADASSSVVLESLTDDERAAVSRATPGDIDTTETADYSNPVPKSHTLCDSPNTQNGVRRAPSREVFEVLHSHQALDIHRGRIVFSTNCDGPHNNSVLVRSESPGDSLRSSILSSDSEIERNVDGGEEIDEKM